MSNLLTKCPRVALCAAAVTGFLLASGAGRKWA